MMFRTIVVLAVLSFACGDEPPPEPPAQPPALARQVLCARSFYLGDGEVIVATYQRFTFSDGRNSSSCQISLPTGSVYNTDAASDVGCKVEFDADPSPNTGTGVFAFSPMEGDPFNRGLAKYVDPGSTFDGVAGIMACEVF
jgi:hypothetical protein